MLIDGIIHDIRAPYGARTIGKGLKASALL